MLTNSPPQTPRKVLCGPFQPALEQALADALAAHRQQHAPLRPLTVLVPSRLLGLHLQRHLAQRLANGHANVRFLTLTDFAGLGRQVETVANPPEGGTPTSDRRANPPEGGTPARIASPLLLELVARQIARETGESFAPVRDTPGFATALLATFTDLREAGVTRLPADRPKLRDLQAAYDQFNQWLAEHELGTESDLAAVAVNAPGLGEVWMYGFYDLNAAQRGLIERLGPRLVFFPTNHAYAAPLRDWFGQLGYKLETLPAQADTAELEIVSAPGEPAEVREAVRTALAWLAADPRRTCNDIAVLCRSREQYDALWRDTLPQFGLRAFFRGGRPLLEQADAQLLLLLLAVLQTDYSRAAVMELACHLGPRSGWDALTVRLGIVGGQAQWRDRLASAARTERYQPVVGELAGFVEALFVAGGKVPATGRWCEFGGAILEAWAALGGRHEMVRNVINGLAELDETGVSVELATFAEFCERALRGAATQAEKFQGGGLFVSNVMGARGLSFRLVILLGLVEKSFPRVIREDPLLTDAERAAISPALPLKLRGYEEERLLFELACGVAGERLVLSWPRLEPASARPRVPSALLLGAAQVRDFQALEKKSRKVPLGAVPVQGPFVDERELDLAALTKLGADDGTYLGAVSALVSRGVTAERARWREKRLTPWDGGFESAAALELLRERFDLERLVTSATALEAFFRCPFSYLQGQVLGLERWEEPEAALAIDPLDLGSLYHKILEEYYKAGGTVEITVVADQYLERFAQSGVTGFAAVWEIKKEILRQELRGFVAREQRRLGGDWRPARFELEFQDLVVAPPVRLRGKIDRIDLSVDGKRARICDYKTGKRPAGYANDSLALGKALQLPLYLLAAEQLLPGISVESACYLYFTMRGGYGEIGFSRSALLEQRASLEQLLATAAAMIRAGTFAQYADEKVCPRCEFRPICGNGVLKLAERKAPDPRQQAFRAIKEPAEPAEAQA